MDTNKNDRRKKKKKEKRGRAGMTVRSIQVYE